jgi:hypothetical protein
MYAIHILTPHLFKIYFSIFTIFISPSRFLIKIVYKSLMSSMHITCYNHLSLLDLVFPVFIKK